MEDTDVYIDDIGAYSNNWNHHVALVDDVLGQLVNNGFTVNPLKCKWASPTFITPKKDGRVRWISNLQQLNKVVKQKQYPLPIISKVLTKRNVYSFFIPLN